MDMYSDENVVLCASNSYEKKYYFNPDFDRLPEDIKNELKIMCVLLQRKSAEYLIWNLTRRQPVIQIHSR